MDVLFLSDSKWMFFWVPFTSCRGNDGTVLAASENVCPFHDPVQGRLLRLASTPAAPSGLCAFLSLVSHVRGQRAAGGLRAG